MSSRYPAPDEYEGMVLPDLPDEMYGDDEELQAPQPRRPDRRRTRQDADEWGETRPARRENPRRRARRVPEDTVQDERPRIEVRRHDDADADVAVRVDPTGRGEVRRDEPSYRRRRPGSRQQPRQRSRRPTTPSRHDRVVEQPRMQAQAITGDVVTDVRPIANERPAPRRRRRNPAWSWKPIVMPQPRQMFEQAMPNLLMALTAVAILILMPYMPFGLPLWAPLVMLPTLLLYVLSNKDVHPMWARAALMNLAIVGTFFPLVIVRQSVLRVPFVEWGNGTLLMPVLTTIGTLLALAILALGAALLCEENPEYAGILFLPAVLLVPFFAGATEITSLQTAFIVLASIFTASAILTIVASMLPGAFPTLVAPIALAIEFLVLPLAESTPIFPVGAGMSAKLLFFALLLASVGLTIFVPMIAVWLRQVRRYVVLNGSQSAAPA